MLYAVVAASITGDDPLWRRIIHIGRVSIAPPITVASQTGHVAAEICRSDLFFPPCSHSYQPCTDSTK